MATEERQSDREIAVQEVLKIQPECLGDRGKVEARANHFSRDSLENLG